MNDPGLARRPSSFLTTMDTANMLNQRLIRLQKTEVCTSSAALLKPLLALAAVAVTLVMMFSRY